MTTIIPWENEEGRNCSCMITIITDLMSKELRKYLNKVE
jgi:hypothetical protein